MIELKNVTKKYGNFKAVDNISFKIEKGEVVGFLGQNGAGKTTTMKMITGLIEPTNGEIFIEGEKISRKSRKCIGYMPENTPLYQELTVKEFIDYMAELKGLKRQERKQQVKKLITDLGLADVENKLIRNISRGYKQRVSLSGALIGNPDILILDPKQVIEIRNLIKSLRKNHTVFISSHILSEISQMCQKVIIINKGKVVAIDTPNNLENKIARNSIVINIEDPNENIEKIKEKIPEIIEIKFINKLEKDIKQYEIFVKENADIRKKLFEILPQENISILELKNSEVGLEEAFIKLIESEGGNKDVGNS